MADNEPTDDQNPPWMRQPGETDKAFEAFGVYRDLGPARSLTIACKALGKSKGTVERWMMRFKWTDRVSAWDDEADRLSRERDLFERQEARRKMIDGHAKGGARVFALGDTIVSRYDVNDPDHGEEAKRLIAEMGALDAAKLMELGAKMERLARGESTERVETREAMQFADTVIDLCLAHLPVESHEAFLSDVEAKLGVGGFQ